MNRAPFILWVGGVGSGKTILAFDEIRRFLEGEEAFRKIKVTESKNKLFKKVLILLGYKDVPAPAPDVECFNLFTNHPCNPESFPEQVKIREWSRIEEVHDFACGAWFLDEIDNWLNSRKSTSLSDDARLKIKEHRKDHLRGFATTQHVSMVDRVFRFFFDEVRVCQMYRIPILGYIFPDTVRPTLACKGCRRIRPDGVGDQATLIGKILGMGTVLTWKVYPPDVLGDIESTSGLEIEKQVEPTSSGWRLFSGRMIRAYDTSFKTATHALHDIKERGIYNK